MGTTRQHRYDQHTSRFEAAINELKLLGDPIQKHIKVQLLCELLQEAFLSSSKITFQLAPETASNFSEAMGQLKSMRNMLVSNRAGKVEDRVTVYPAYSTSPTLQDTLQA
jgi:hypothetical protein